MKSLLIGCIMVLSFFGIFLLEAFLAAPAPKRIPNAKPDIYFLAHARVDSKTRRICLLQIIKAPDRVKANALWWKLVSLQCKYYKANRVMECYSVDPIGADNTIDSAMVEDMVKYGVYLK